MNKITLLLIILFLHHVQSSFFNLAYFLQPIINPGIIGSTSYQIEGRRRDRDRYSNQRFQQPTQNTQAPSTSNQNQSIPQATKNNNQSQQKNKQNLRTNDNTFDPGVADLYKAIGIQQDVIFNKILPVHMAAVRDLNKFFYKFSISPYSLYLSLKNLKQMIQWIQATYLNDLNTVVVGNNNTLIGEHLYIKGNNQKVIGKQNFIFTPNDQNSQLKGNNIVRLGKFDVDLDFVQKSKFNPYKCVTLLQKDRSWTNIFSMFL